MAASLQKDAQVDDQDAVVSLTKQKKRTISVSLTRVAIARLDKSVRDRHSNRSDTIEQLIHRYIDSLFQK
ncbi:ribbon-helix-helix protein, CopG family [Aeromonas encheleia]|uniref:ribbon-helix-helix protein, CopG family n=1 Tax=Aeromonas encheleia TaxID=73010 RepID=UPI001F567CB2|nr:ribbon-helix-helix protein, CopG family [Aeromonas encheleia]UNP90557.1 ribbon-helix-helix protein, CopG family [Aeromonas encheleia]